MASERLLRQPRSGSRQDFRLALQTRVHQPLGVCPMPSTLELTEGCLVAERREPSGTTLVFCGVIPDDSRRSAIK